MYKLTVFKITTYVRRPGAIGNFQPYNLLAAATTSEAAQKVAAHALIDLGWETGGTEALNMMCEHESLTDEPCLLETPRAP